MPPASSASRPAAWGAPATPTPASGGRSRSRRGQCSARRPLPPRIRLCIRPSQRPHDGRIRSGRPPALPRCGRPEGPGLPSQRNRPGRAVAPWGAIATRSRPGFGHPLIRLLQQPPSPPPWPPGAGRAAAGRPQRPGVWHAVSLPRRGAAAAASRVAAARLRTIPRRIPRIAPRQGDRQPAPVRASAGRGLNSRRPRPLLYARGRAGPACRRPPELAPPPAPSVRARVIAPAPAPVREDIRRPPRLCDRRRGREGDAFPAAGAGPHRPRRRPPLPRPAEKRNLSRDRRRGPGPGHGRPGGRAGPARARVPPRAPPPGAPGRAPGGCSPAPKATC